MPPPGLPALAFPCGRMENGMPFALQAIAKPGREAALVAASRAFGDRGASRAAGPGR